MLVEIGHFALVLAFLVAAVQGVVPLLGAAAQRRALMAMARPAALLQLALLALSFAVFVHAFVVSDFSVLNVYENSSLEQPLLYKLTAVWGSHEGSMLLWVLMLAVYGGGVALWGSALPLSLRARTLAVQGLLCCGTLAYVLFTSNPFARLLPAPLEGRALNPLLQDPGLALHPPLLYFGYVGFSITYSFAIAGLIEGRITAAWARLMRPWLLLAWCSLTAGIAAGSHWAYYVLGWGGWWYWDPVENASFMPWLLGTALLHSALVVEKREALQRWTVLLAILTFGMSLVGTFLVRSGIITSVHAFALDPSRGIFILALVALVVGGALLLYAWRAPALAPGNPFAPVSREGALVLNNLVLSAGMATVFLGTFYPLFAQVWSGVKLSVGPPYFNATFLPIMVPAIAAMVVAPMLAWRRGDLGGALRRLLPALVGALLAPLAVPAAAWRRLRHLPRSSYGCALGHFGVGMLIAGIAVTTAWRSERIATLDPGESLTIAGRTLRFAGVSDRSVANYREQRATVVVEQDGAPVATLRPERRYYPVAGSATTHTAILTNGLADLYLALGDPDGHGGWVLRAYFNPLVPWIWFGAAIAALGGLVSLSDRRLRLKLPAGKEAGAVAIAPRPAEPG